MNTYIYFCERCQSTFTAEVADDAVAELPCPKCEYPHAIRAFPMPERKASDCAPGSGC